jgi:hypothetical protein
LLLLLLVVVVVFYIIIISINNNNIINNIFISYCVGGDDDYGDVDCDANDNRGLVAGYITKNRYVSHMIGRAKDIISPFGI